MQCLCPRIFSFSFWFSILFRMLLIKNCKGITILEEYLFFMNVFWFIRHTLYGQEQQYKVRFGNCYNINPK